jgi:hypothetical protein
MFEWFMRRRQAPEQEIPPPVRVPAAAGAQILEPAPAAEVQPAETQAEATPAEPVKRRRGRPPKDPNAPPKPPRAPKAPKTVVDLDAQPAGPFNHWRRSDRSTSELIGLARGIMADGTVNKAEFDLLVDWLESNPDSLYCYPGNVLLKRVERILEDGVVEQEELDDLGELLRQLTGESQGRIQGANASTELPLNDPAPPVEFQGRCFVFTGKFALGPRTICEEEVVRRGGRTNYTITQKVDYLVIGVIGSRDWYHTSHGRKIEEAVRNRENGHGIAIISEDHWAEHLD